MLIPPPSQFLSNPGMRKAYYLQNCYGDQSLSISVTGRFSSSPHSAAERDRETVRAGELTLGAEIYEEASCRLLVASKGKKVLATPCAERTIIRDAKRPLLQVGDDCLQS
jgi:hypothetical protein